MQQLTAPARSWMDASKHTAWDFPIIYPVALFSSAAALVRLEWHTDEDMVTFAALVVASGALGLLRPGLFMGSGLTLGLVVPALNLFSLASGSWPSYKSYARWAAHGVGYSAGLCLLVLPALLAAVFGRAASKKVHADEMTA